MHSSLSRGPQGPDFLCLCCRLSQVQVDVTFPKVPCLSSLILVTTLQRKIKNSGSMINTKFSITISKMVRFFFNFLPYHPDPHPKSVLMWPHILWHTEGFSPLAPLPASRAPQPVGKSTGEYRGEGICKARQSHGKGRCFPSMGYQRPSLNESSQLNLLFFPKSLLALQVNTVPGTTGILMLRLQHTPKWLSKWMALNSMTIQSGRTERKDRGGSALQGHKDIRKLE